MKLGPDPLGAFEFIDKNDLYGTIFSNIYDHAKPDTLSWSTIFHSFSELLNDTAEGSSVPLSTRRFLNKILLRNDDDVYYGWVLAAIAPWACVPLKENGQVIVPTSKKLPLCATVLRDQLRLDNKTINIAAAGSNHYNEIVKFKESLLDEHYTKDLPQCRLEVGLFLRSLGAEWRSSYLLALLLECVEKDKTSGRDTLLNGSIAKHILMSPVPTVFNSYEAFLSRVVEMDLVDVHNLRPLVNGKEICAELGVPSGPWMSKALGVVIDWQLLHPGLTEKKLVFEEIQNKRNEIGWDQVAKKPVKSKNKK